MIKDVIKTFEKEYKKYGESYITDDHIPSDGEYIIVDPRDDGFVILDRIEIKQNKKTREVETTSPFFEFIQQADYMSRYLESNKAIKDKNIHSNNYLTFFVKSENLYNGKITNEVISKYYEVFKNPFLKYTGKQKIAYEELEHKYGKSDTANIENIEKWIKDNVFKLTNKREKSYLKVFFKYNMDEYIKESEKYILANIYNKVDYNTMINNRIFGLPNDNVGLNSKKPYLQNKTRKNYVPYLLSQEEVLLQKKFFDYLMNQVSRGKANIYVSDYEIKSLSNDETLDESFQGYFLRVKKGMEVEIHDFDTIGLYKPDIIPINIVNFLNLKKSNLEYKKIYQLRDIKNLINETFFHGSLTVNYFTEPKDIKVKTPALKRNLLLSRGTLFTWFYKGIDNNVWKVLNQATLDLIKASINKGYLLGASEQFNVRFSLKNYFEEGENMSDVLVDIKNKLREKININFKQPTFSIETDDEYYFAVGQLSSYFISLSKSKVKPHSLANPIFNSKTDKKIKEELKKLFKKYNYAILGNKRFNNLYSMISSYIPEEKVNDDLIIAGYLHSNLIYEELNKDNKKNEEEINHG